MLSFPYFLELLSSKSHGWNKLTLQRMRSLSFALNHQCCRWSFGFHLQGVKKSYLSFPVTAPTGGQNSQNGKKVKPQKGSILLVAAAFCDDVDVTPEGWVPEWLCCTSMQHSAAAETRWVGSQHLGLQEMSEIPAFRTSGRQCDSFRSVE